MKRGISPQSTATNKGAQRAVLPITAKFSEQRIPTASVPRMAFKVSQAAQALGLDRGAVYDLCRTGKLRFVRCAGGTMLIPAAAIEDFLGGDGAA